MALLDLTGNVYEVEILTLQRQPDDQGDIRLGSGRSMMARYRTLKAGLAAKAPLLLQRINGLHHALQRFR